MGLEQGYGSEFRYFPSRPAHPRDLGRRQLLARRGEQLPRGRTVRLDVLDHRGHHVLLSQRDGGR